MKPSSLSLVSLCRRCNTAKKPPAQKQIDCILGGIGRGAPGSFCSTSSHHWAPDLKTLISHNSYWAAAGARPVNLEGLTSAGISQTGISQASSTIAPLVRAGTINPTTPTQLPSKVDVIKTRAHNSHYLLCLPPSTTLSSTFSALLSNSLSSYKYSSIPSAAD